MYSRRTPYIKIYILDELPLKVKVARGPKVEVRKSRKEVETSKVR